MRVRAVDVRRTARWGEPWYSESVVDENYLRGVQAADEDGLIEFRTIFPGCYAGRWPHVHFEVYESLVTTEYRDFRKCPSSERRTEAAPDVDRGARVECVRE